MAPANGSSACAADFDCMARALRLARRGLYSTRPNPRVGCVIVKDGAVVGEGFHHDAGGPHAEVEALRAAGELAAGGTAYVTLEPCSHHGRTPPCAPALIQAAVARVVYAVQDPNPRVAGGGASWLREAGIAVTGGVLEHEARRLNRGFFSRFERGRPFVCLKLAMSLDGNVALAGGESQWITGPAARADVQRLRAESAGILTGIGTVLADDPRLDVRDPRYDLAGQPPQRIVLDTHLRMPVAARMLALPGVTRVFTARGRSGQAAALVAAGALVDEIDLSGDRIHLPAAFARLAALEMNEILVEAGPALAGALVAAGLVDEYVLYLAPKLLGATARGAFALPPLPALAAAPDLQITEVMAVGPDLRLVARPQLT